MTVVEKASLAAMVFVAPHAAVWSTENSDNPLLLAWVTAYVLAQTVFIIAGRRGH